MALGAAINSMWDPTGSIQAGREKGYAADGSIAGTFNPDGSYTAQGLAARNAAPAYQPDAWAQPSQAAAPAPAPASAPSQYGGYGAASGGVNPYTQQQADSIRGMVNQNLSQNIMPGIASGALANGSYGGSRQGIAEGVAAGNASTGLANSLANLYSGNYQNDVTNGLQQQSLNNNLALGMGSLGNQSTAQNQNFYTSQRGQDLASYQLGSNLYGAGVNGNLGLGSGMYNTGQTYQQAPLQAVQGYSNTISPYSGLNSAQTQTGASSPIAGALGGAQLGNTLANLWNSNGGSSGSSVLSNTSPYANSGTDYNALAYR